MHGAATAAALLVALAGFSAVSYGQEGAGLVNLLVNPRFEFHAFENHRLGKAVSHTSHNVAFWNTEAWGDVTVVRESHAPAEVRPAFSTGNLVSLAPGKRFSQFLTLPEGGLSPGESVSLFVHGHQPAAGSLRARIVLLKLDSEDGTWSPGEYGMSDKRTFPRHARGELVVVASHEARAEQVGPVELKIEDVQIVGHFTADGKSHSDDVNTVGLRVEFENTATEGAVWVYWPCLCRGPRAWARLAEGRPMVPYYRHLPRTMQKLWKGEPVHILAMGSSIDRGSANPPLYLYDEDPASPGFKTPLSDRVFEPGRVGRPDLEGYVGWWQHYFAYTGRLRLELMRKFNLPVSSLCLNFMACDGSSVGEAHSGLVDYCSLALAPDENTNGHTPGRTWRELYPGLFERAEGPGPDLVIFGSGANEKTDTPDEVAVFEGAVRWIQRHYANCEFLICMFQSHGGYTPNPGDMQALALRYQIPMIDYGKANDDLRRWTGDQAPLGDTHPQAAGHYLWFKQIERTFECWDPIETGQVQVRLPERLMATTYGWEGEMVTYGEGSPRLAGPGFVFEDTAVNCWGNAEGEGAEVYVDGKKVGQGRNAPRRDVRNSMFRHGRCRLGDRHILEIAGESAKLTAVDAKVCPDRRFIGVDSGLWDLAGATVGDFGSEWGAPYGSRQAVLVPGQAFTLDVVCTDLSVAYVDTAEGGVLRVVVDGTERLAQPASIPFVDLGKREHYMENRRGVLGLGFGLHRVRLEAAEGPVPVLGVFAYDSRANRRSERRLVGVAAPGDTVSFSWPFAARPVVICHGGLSVRPEDISPGAVGFGGSGTGSYEVIGE